MRQRDLARHYAVGKGPERLVEMTGRRDAVAPEHAAVGHDEVVDALEERLRLPGADGTRAVRGTGRGPHTSGTVGQPVDEERFATEQPTARIGLECGQRELEEAGHDPV